MGQRSHFIPYADSIVKSLAPVSTDLRHCLIQGESTPWFQMVTRDSLQPADAAPMLPLYYGDTRIPWMQIGDIEVAYLNLLPGMNPPRTENALFLA